MNEDTSLGAILRIRAQISERDTDSADVYNVTCSTTRSRIGSYRYQRLTMHAAHDGAPDARLAMAYSNCFILTTTAMRKTHRFSVGFAVVQMNNLNQRG